MASSYCALLPEPHVTKASHQNLPPSCCTLGGKKSMAQSFLFASSNP